MGSHLSLRLLPALIVDSYGCMNNKVKLSLFCPFKSSGISASLLASAASFLLFSESSLSPCHAAQSLCHVSSRLLEANRHLTAEGGAILLQRGATETPAGKGLLGDRAHHSTSPAPAVGRERCQQPSSSMGYGVPWIQVSTA